MEIRRGVVVLAVLSLFFFTRFARAGGDWIQQSIDLTINARFDSAQSVLRPHLSNPREKLAAWFYLASVLNSRMTHFEDYGHPALFLSALDSVLKFSGQQLKRNKNDNRRRARLMFYRGSASGYKAFYEGRTGRWLSALNNGLSSVSDLQRSVELDSTLYEAYLGIGVYQYWRSTKLKLLLWTPFLSDLREQGIANIKKAIRFSKRSRYMAMHQLIYILVNYHHFDEAWQYAQKAVKAYPRSPFMRWAYAHTLFMMRRNRQAAAAFNLLLTLLNSRMEKNPSHMLTCRVRLAEIYQRLGEDDNCRSQLKLALEYTEEELSQSGRAELEKARAIWQNCALKTGKTAVSSN